MFCQQLIWSGLARLVIIEQYTASIELKMQDGERRELAMFHFKLKQILIKYIPRMVVFNESIIKTDFKVFESDILKFYRLMWHLKS